jgi:redox-sensitive bicupin YhaK (pirin superfamily)
VRVICGEAEGVAGPVQDIVTEPQYLDVALAPGTVFTHQVASGHTAFAYVIDGEGHFGADPEAAGRLVTPSDNGTVVVYSREGDTVRVSAEARPVRFLLISGKPLGEPVAWYGPIVMNSQSELQTAFEELRNGTFLKHPAA